MSVEIKTIKAKIVSLKKSIKAANLRYEGAETDEDRAKEEKTLKTFRTKLENAKTELTAAKAERRAELKESMKNGAKSIGTKTGIAITGGILVIAAGITYFTLKGDEEEVVTASDNV